MMKANDARQMIEEKLHSKIVSDERRYIAKRMDNAFSKLQFSCTIDGNILEENAHWLEELGYRIEVCDKEGKPYVKISW
ncbi:MAG: hypothetical protein IJ220_05925 [Clostridia bacterium]|nr:hypothetical protein [Clostridia bacterium]